MTYEELVGLIYNAITNVHEFGASFDTYSQSVADALIKEKFIEVTDETGNYNATEPDNGENVQNGPNATTSHNPSPTE